MTNTSIDKDALNIALITMLKEKINRSSNHP
jgi:hypothetical protein